MWCAFLPTFIVQGFLDVSLTLVLFFNALENSSSVSPHVNGYLPTRYLRRLRLLRLYLVCPFVYSPLDGLPEIQRARLCQTLSSRFGNHLLFELYFDMTSPFPLCDMSRPHRSSRYIRTLECDHVPPGSACRAAHISITAISLPLPLQPFPDTPFTTILNPTSSSSSTCVPLPSSPSPPSPLSAPAP